MRRSKFACIHAIWCYASCSFMYSIYLPMFDVRRLLLVFHFESELFSYLVDDVEGLAARTATSSDLFGKTEDVLANTSNRWKCQPIISDHFKWYFWVKRPIVYIKINSSSGKWLTTSEVKAPLTFPADDCPSLWIAMDLRILWNWMFRVSLRFAKCFKLLIFNYWRLCRIRSLFHLVPNVLIPGWLSGFQSNCENHRDVLCNAPPVCFCFPYWRPAAMQLHVKPHETRWASGIPCYSTRALIALASPDHESRRP